MRKFAALGIFLIGLVTAPSARATIAIPNGLSDGEQELILNILAFGTAFRPLTNPFPLGGYSGFEMGVSYESIPTSDVSRFGNGAQQTSTLGFPRLGFSKGVFSNIDVMMSFIPYSESTGLGIYSGAARWGFFQATFVPAVFSVLVSGANTNINNALIAQSYGVDLVIGVNVNPVSFYVGAGTVYAQGQFNPTLTSSGLKSNQIARSFHNMLGATISVGEVFIAAQLDAYTSPVVSSKLGVRF